MKKSLLVIGILALVGLLSGCEFLANLRTKILNQANTTAESVTKKVGEIGDQLEKTKESVEQKVEDVKSAVKEVGEAVDAVKKVTGSEMGTSTE
jgi:peptidoglycan hydrolase CwlO-like protein